MNNELTSLRIIAGALGMGEIGRANESQCLRFIAVSRVPGEAVNLLGNELRYLRVIVLSYGAFPVAQMNEFQCLAAWLMSVGGSFDNRVDNENTILAKLAQYYLDSAFTPATIPGLQLWLDDTGLTGGGGSSIALWPDRSGHGRDVSQGTTGQRPTVVTGVFGAYPGARFDGADDVLRGIDSGLPTGDLTLFTVSRPAALPSTDYGVIIGYGNGSAGQSIMSIYVSGSSDCAISQYGSSLPSALPDTSPFIQSVTAASASWHQWRNGGAPVSNSMTKATASSGEFAVGGSNASQGSVFFLHGDIAAVLVYDSVLSTADRQAVEDYLDVRYGIPISR